MSDNCFVGFPGWLQATTVPFPEVGEILAPLLKMPLSSLLCEQVDTSTLVFLHARDGVKMSRYFCCLSDSPFELFVISLHPTCVLIFCFGKSILWFYVQRSCWLCQSAKTSRASLVVFVKKTHWKESSQGSMCCPTGDTSLIWATFSQRSLWQLKMTTIVTNLWSPKIQNHRRYWVEISGPNNLVPDIASGQEPRTICFCCSAAQYFRGGVTEIGKSEMEGTRPAV